MVSDQVVWVSGSMGTVGRTADGGQTWKMAPIPGYEKVDFRSLYAFDSLQALVANAGSPMHVLRTNDGGRSWTYCDRGGDGACAGNGSGDGYTAPMAGQLTAG